MKPKFSVIYPDGSHAKALPTRAAPIQEAIAASPTSSETKQVSVTTLPLYGIRIEDDGTNVVVTSCLQATNPHEYHEGLDEMNIDYLEWKARMTTIEMLIKYHYMSGVKVTSKAYLKGIEDYVDYMKVHK